MADDSVQPPSEADGAQPRVGLVGAVAAAVLVAVYLVFVALQWSHIDAADTAWARRQALLTGLEALAFSGLGALLGTTVQRHATRQAEQHAARAERKAAANARDAEKGRALQNAIAARMARPHGEPTRGGGGGTADPAMAELDELARRYDVGG
jgi:uncharacterized membrane protein YsdA (DUF1294 family)